MVAQKLAFCALTLTCNPLLLSVEGAGIPLAQGSGAGARIVIPPEIPPEVTALVREGVQAIVQSCQGQRLPEVINWCQNQVRGIAQAGERLSGIRDWCTAQLPQLQGFAARCLEQFEEGFRQESDEQMARRLQEQENEAAGGHAAAAAARRPDEGAAARRRPPVEEPPAARRQRVSDDGAFLGRNRGSVSGSRGSASGSPPPTTLTQNQIDQLPTCPCRGPVDNINCCVCMSDCEAGEEIKTLPCMHRFHKGCIDQWLRQKNECPMCKRPVVV